MKIEQICMQVMTWHWFKILRNSDPQLIWETFKRSLMDCCGDYHSGSRFSQLKRLQQTSIIDEAWRHSKSSGHEYHQWWRSNAWDFFFFLGGMKEDIHMEVLAFEPPNPHRLYGTID